VWFVIDNNTETFKIYLSGGVFTTPVQIVSLPGSLNSTPATEAGTFSFRNQATEGPLTALKALIRTGANNYAQLFVDDIFHATGDVLSLPSAFCVNPYTLNVTINQPITPTFTQVAPICSGNSFILPATSANNISGTWTPAIDNAQTTAYTFIPTAGQCASTQTMTVVVNPVPVASVPQDIVVYDGDIVAATSLNSNLGNTSFTWQNSNPAIGLPASGSGNIPSFQAVNLGDNPVTGTITVIPSANGCSGAAVQFKITVLPLSKDIFIPNLFSPNGDGKNDNLFVYGKYIDKIEMNIFNQWGELVKTIRNKNQGWDGTHKGKPQPVGVYVYTAKIIMKDGRNINKKGSITIYR
jgi:gliding motility-associated-like protein